MADIVGDMPGKNALVGTLSTQKNLVGVVSPLSDRYEQGKADAEENAISLVNEGINGIDGSSMGIENIENVEQIPDKIDEIFEVTNEQSFQFGYEAGYEQGKTDGEQYEYDAFWDAFQQNGNRDNYQNAFWAWDGAAFKPKYAITGLLLQAFQNSAITEVKVPIVSGNSSCQNLFYKCANLVSVESIDITGATSTQNMFYSCFALEEIRFEGRIPIGVGFPHSNLLSAESVQSIIDHLEDLTGATAQTITFHKTVGGNLTQTQKDAISAKNWTLVY